MNEGFKLPELLAPAGNMERLLTAFCYGADACYIGMTAMSLRNFADNFTIEQLKEASLLAHSMGKRIYVACNAFARDEDLTELPKLLLGIEKAGADAIILNDPGVLAVARRVVPDMELHLSTQANTLNSEAAKFWHEQGIKRIILARELRLDQIRYIREHTPKSLEFEAFVHGAMCVSYSGRCLLSNYINGRDSNKGECAQPCRWIYELREKGSNGDYMTIEEDERGSYILNSKDMNLIEHLPELCSAGLSSLKIEGRMKTAYYVATVVNAYRLALDEYARCVLENRPFKVPSDILNELNYSSHRPYTTGFMFDECKMQGQATGSGGYIQEAVFAAIVISYDADKKQALIEQRNRFFVGDRLYILAPRDIGRSFEVKSIVRCEDGQSVLSAPHPREKLLISCDEPLEAGSFLRLKERIVRSHIYKKAGEANVSSGTGQ
ncbi:MAG: U32 family peptidase [Clostridia bacterium]|nr:U32 family peptidase [Clostridia bacterium]